MSVALPNSIGSPPKEAFTAGRLRHHIITCEFPPQSGGVGDYTYSLAENLADSGDEVHVWCPNHTPRLAQTKFSVHPYLGRSSPSDLRQISLCLNQFPSARRLIVQWVPHGYGYRSLNLGFCLWLLKRARVNGDYVAVMVHEPFLSFESGNWKHYFAASVHRVMITVLLAAASDVWLSTSAWENKLRPYCLGRHVDMQWLPIPSNIQVHSDSARVAQIRSKHSPAGGALLGHFGTYGPLVGEMLLALIPMSFGPLTNHSLILMGKGSHEFRNLVLKAHPGLINRISATGSLDAASLSCHIQACDLMVQPYPDGITTRRTSAMVSLVHARPLITTSGHLTESFWHQQSCISIEPAADLRLMAKAVEALLKDPGRRDLMAQGALGLYNRRFHIKHTISCIRPQGCIPVS